MIELNANEEGLRPLTRRLAHAFQLIRRKPSFEWARVASINPVRIQFAGDDAPLPVTHSTIAGDLMVNDLVRVEIIGPHMIIHGVAKGADRTRRFATKAELDLWSPADGAQAWVEIDKTQYVRSGQQWRVHFADTSWVTLALNAGFEPVDPSYPLRVRRVGSVGYIWGGVTGPTFTNIATFPEWFTASVSADYVVAGDTDTTFARIRIFTTTMQRRAGAMGARAIIEVPLAS